MNIKRHKICTKKSGIFLMYNIISCQKYDEYTWTQKWHDMISNITNYYMLFGGILIEL
jgi:hypothetical protein